MGKIIRSTRMLRGSLGESAVSLVFEKRVYVLKGTNKYLFSWIFSLFTSFPLFPLVRRIFCYPLPFLSTTMHVLSFVQEPYEMCIGTNQPSWRMALNERKPRLLHRQSFCHINAMESWCMAHKPLTKGRRAYETYLATLGRCIYCHSDFDWPESS